MDVLIKGMTMPEVGNWKTIRVYYDGTCAEPNWQGDCKIMKGCEAVPIPDHGDLADRDEFIGRLQSWALLIAMGHGDDDEWVKCIGEVCDRLYDSPVVIPAERSEE